MATGIPYLGSKISLISKSEIRYEGILYTIDTKESTVALAKVRSFGTEDRPTDRPVAPRDEVYEYIIFRGADIKDIRVCQPPKPNLESGIHNDPAIVEHSAVTSVAPGPGLPQPGGAGFASAGNVPKPGPQFGAIGSAPIAAPFSTSSRPNDASPVMDAVVDEPRSRGSSPGAGSGSRPDSSVRSPNPQQDQSGQRRGQGRQNRGHDQRGGANSFHRGGRGRGNNYQPQRGGQHQYRGGAGTARFGMNRNEGATGTSGYQPGRPHSSKKEPLKFDADYDFEQANEQFQEFLTKFEKANLDGREGRNGEADDELNDHEVDDQDYGNDHDDKNSENFYDKTKSFFDNISCEALERSKGNLSRPDWKAEKKLNRETFGAAGNFGGGRGRGYYRGGGYYGGRGGYNRGRGGNSGNGYYGGGNRGGYGGGGGGGYNNGYNRYSREGGSTGYREGGSTGYRDGVSTGYRDGVSTGGYRGSGGGSRGGPRGGGF